MTVRRKSPEQLLKHIHQEELKRKRGKLKIYLGAAPGVGKTYEMLHDALEKKHAGLNVLIGVVESHGRGDIENFLKNFTVLPRQSVPYREKTYLEFDLDAALIQHPTLILVDEMAHTNAPNLRHSKRWQDINELLDRGIDVYTTLNVQHIESLKDDVAQIIQAPIKETVPDSMIEKADTIELIDLPPEDLLKRLQEGKIYIPKQAELALEHFFRRGNLIALRELALRITAERVGTDVLLYRQGEGIKHIWPIRDKILVCVGPNPEVPKLIRAAKRMASSLQAEWLAVYIETPRIKSSGDAHNQAIQHLHLAEQLGAEVHVITGFDMVKELMSFAREQNVTQIMVWKHIVNRWKNWIYKNLADEIVRHSGEIDVYIMTGNTKEPITKGSYLEIVPWKTYGLTVSFVVLATLLNGLLYPLIAANNLVMIYLIGVAVVILFGRLGPSILVSVLGVFAYGYFFIQPFYSLAISDIEYFLTLLSMLLIIQIISRLTILARHQAISARLMQHQTTALYTFSRKLTSTRGVDKLLQLGAHYMANVFDSDVMALFPKNEQLKIKASTPASQHLDEKEQSIAQWVYEMGQAAGLSTDTLAFSKALYLPLIASTGPIGVLRIYPRSSQLLTPQQRGLLESCTNQLALALEVDLMHERTQKRELEIAKDTARNSLLKAIFRDLHAPLRKVTEKINHLNKNDDFESNLEIQISKLNQLHNNLHQIIELDSHTFKINKTSVSLIKVIECAIKKCTQMFPNRIITTHFPELLPQIQLDKNQIQTVISNMLDNAIKFSPVECPIHISVTLEHKQVVVNIKDCGKGITLEEKSMLFKKFYRGKKDGVTTPGLGLGLSICQKIIAAHHGKIWVDNMEPQGAVFHFSLPLQE